MARIVLGIATSHTPMLNAPAEDWPRFIDRDGVRDFLDKDGRPATYDELLARADPAIAAELTPERLAARHAAAQQGVEHLRAAIGRAELDALIVVGDDHQELYQDAIYRRLSPITARPPAMCHSPASTGPIGRGALRLGITRSARRANTRSIAAWRGI